MKGLIFLPCASPFRTDTNLLGSNSSADTPEGISAGGNTPQRIIIPPYNGWYFSFGHSPNTTGYAQVRLLLTCQPCNCYLLPVNGLSLKAFLREEGGPRSGGRSLRDFIICSFLLCTHSPSVSHSLDSSLSEGASGIYTSCAIFLFDFLSPVNLF